MLRRRLGILRKKPGSATPSHLARIIGHHAVLAMAESNKFVDCNCDICKFALNKLFEMEEAFRGRDRA